MSPASHAEVRKILQQAFDLKNSPVDIGAASTATVMFLRNNNQFARLSSASLPSWVGATVS